MADRSALLRAVIAGAFVLPACADDGAAATDGASGTGGDDGPSSGVDADADDADVGDASDDGPIEGDAATIEPASLPTTLACGEAFAAAITVRNSGTTTWSRAEGYALGAVDDSDPLSASGRIELPDGVDVEPGATHAFAFELVAPVEPGQVTTDWRMVHEQVQWFGESAVEEVEIACMPAERGGPVRLEGHSFVDDGGPFVALGATMMWGAWGYRNDRARLEENLAFLADNGFHYVRALGVVGDPNGEDSWDGREIDFHWPDYADVIRGFTELAWDEYGLRVEWTLIGDGQV